MKEEEYRDYITAGIIDTKKKRYNIRDIIGWYESYKANPSTYSGVGQLVFALYAAATPVCMGQCVSGSSLIPWGVGCCSGGAGVSSACSANTCVTCGFSIGSGTYLALGSVGKCCGATLWRRIS